MNRALTARCRGKCHQPARAAVAIKIISAAMGLASIAILVLVTRPEARHAYQ